MTINTKKCKLLKYHTTHTVKGQTTYLASYIRDSNKSCKVTPTHYELIFSSIKQGYLSCSRWLFFLASWRGGRPPRPRSPTHPCTCSSCRSRPQTLSRRRTSRGRRRRRKRTTNPKVPQEKSMQVGRDKILR